MSLITRCPACRTMFKVVPDQLRVSEGWVRCGKCEEIFDASAHLQEAVARDLDVGSAASPDAVPFEGALTAAIAAQGQVAAAGPPTSVPGMPPKEEPARTGLPAVDFELKDPKTDGAGLVEEVVPNAALLPDGSAYGVQGEAVEPTSGMDARKDSAPPGEPAEVELSFMRQARLRSRWHRPVVRAILIVFCLLLASGLLLQLVVHERDRIAAVEPGSRPLLDEICLLMDCRVAALRQIESVVIDSSAFSKTKGEVYRLSFTLKNNAPIDLAMPAVELALTDTLDQPLLRRVFQPLELGVKSGVIPAASEINSTLVLTIKTNGNSERVAGYRLLAFYP